MATTGNNGNRDRANPLERLRLGLATGVRKRLGLPHSRVELDPYLAGKELVFRAPPFSAELVDAIRLISPQFRLRPDEASREFWELNQNGLCWGEFEALEPFLKALARPSRVLDIGPGMGRSTVFFKRKMGWGDVPFVLYESSGESTRYTKAGERFSDSFCGNLDVLRAVLDFNRIEGREIVDAKAIDARLSGIEGSFDFVYSFFAVGFHWAIGAFLDELLELMSDRAIGAFTLHDRVRLNRDGRLDELEGIPHRVVDFRRSWPRRRWTRMLVMAKSEEPLAPAAE